jgi:trigger factor
VTAELDRLRDGHATLEEPSEPRAAAKGDAVTIDFEVEVEGQKVPDAGTNDFQIALGRGTLFPAIEEGLVGMSVGDKKDLDVPMPAAHPHKKLRGKRRSASCRTRTTSSRKTSANSTRSKR